MGHQPYEQWILEESELTDEQIEALDTHLASCEECSALNASWGALAGLFASPPIAAPTAGFVQRWEVEFEKRKSLEQQFMIRRLLLFLGVSITITFFLLIGTALARTSLAAVAASTMQSVTQAYIVLAQIQGIFETILRSLPPAVPIVFWILITTSFSLLALLWTASMWRITFKGAKNYELN